MKNKLPIGYYLKKADNLLTEGINDIQNEFGITRTYWQILNSIKTDTEIDRQKLSELHSEFANKETIDKAVATLMERQLIREENFLTLTEKGQELYQNCFAKQQEFRQKAMKNITDDEYFQMITTLEKIIYNLE